LLSLFPSLAPSLALALALGTAVPLLSAHAGVPPPPPAKPDIAVLASSPEGPDRSVALATAESGSTEIALALRSLPGLPLPPGPKPEVPHLSEADLIAAAGFEPDQVGYLVFDLDTGEYLTGHNATQAAFLPASVMKVPTTVAALSVLGPDYTFPTLVRFEGDRLGGLWHGTLALVGGGDPVLEAADLRQLVGMLKAAGLERLDGPFVYDDSALISAPVLEPSQPVEYSYNPGLSALTLDFNRVRVEWNGDAVTFVGTHGTPPVAPIRMERDHQPAGWSRAGAPLHHAFLPQGTHDANGLIVERWKMSPRAPNHGAMWLPVKAPAPFVAAVFRALAADAGMTLPEPQPALGPARGTIVAQHFSQPLNSIVTAGLKHSNNLLAELVGLSTTRQLEGRPLSIPDSAARLERWLTETLSWVDWTGFHMANHSGLSPDSRASPEQIVSILRYAIDKNWGGESYLHLMPSRSFPDPDGRVVASLVHAGDLKPIVWAKSGTMFHGRGLAGVARGRSGNRLVFAVFTSDLKARQAFDDGYRHYIRTAVSAAKRQLGRARDLEHALLLKWVGEH